MLWLQLIRSSKRCPGGHCLGYHPDILLLYHDDVIKWKHFPRYWPFVRGIHRSPVNSPHKGQWRGALMFSLICVRINGWVNNRYAGDLRRHQVHYDVIVTITYQTIVSQTSASVTDTFAESRTWIKDHTPQKTVCIRRQYHEHGLSIYITELYEVVITFHALDTRFWCWSPHEWNWWFLGRIEAEWL